ncbi:MAG TPA: glycosyltransferase family 39 protein [Pyrinomonadaceae bacterium]|nr:glycosyltransferase family 39 protein [Pyrinomonadaceae bacterium]
MTEPPTDARASSAAWRFITTQSILTALLVSLYVAARLWTLTATCLWFDEIFSVTAARHTWGELWGFAAADLIHPPLFYAFLKIWTTLGGESLFWLRLLPALTSVLALVPFFLLARELRLTAPATNIALLLLAANGYLIKYAQEVRMYSLLLLLALVSLWLFAKLFNSSHTSRALLLALTIANLLLVYTHYYGWLVVACEGLFLILRDRRKLASFALACALVALLFAPWVAACAGAAGEGGGLAQNIGWIGRPGGADAAQMFALLSEPFHFRQSSDQPLYARGGLILGLLLIGLPIVALLAWRARGKNEDSQTEDAGREREGRRGVVAFLVFFALAPALLAFVASYALPVSVWGTRHLIFVAAPYAMLAGVALAALRPFALKASALVLICCWFFLAGALTLARREGLYVWCAWEGLAASAARDEAASANGVAIASDAPTGVYAFEDLVAYHLWFALDHGGGERRFKVVVLKGVPGVREDPAYFLPRRFDGVGVASGTDSIGGARFWAAFRAARWDESRPPLKLLLERGYRAGKIYETSAQGQRAFLALFVRDDGARPLSAR